MFSPKQPKLLFIQLTKFPPQTTSKSECANFPNTSNEITKTPGISGLSPNPCFRISSPIKTSKPHSRRELKNTRLPCQTHTHTHTQICHLVALPQWRDYSRQSQTEKNSETLSMSPIVSINNFHKKAGLIPPAPKISILPTSQISKPVPNVLTTDIQNSSTITSMSETPSSQIEILIPS